MLHRIVRIKKEDLKMVRALAIRQLRHVNNPALKPNHLLGYRRLFLQLRFKNITNLLSVRRDLLPLALKNSQKMDAIDAYAEVVNATAHMQVSIDDSWTAEAEGSTSRSKNADPKDLIVDIREYDVPYYLRVAIDNGTVISSGLELPLTALCRYSCWTLVHRDRHARGRFYQHHQGEGQACRTGGHGLRYRNYEVAT